MRLKVSSSNTGSDDSASSAAERASGVVAFAGPAVGFAATVGLAAGAVGFAATDGFAGVAFGAIKVGFSLDEFRRAVRRAFVEQQQTTLQLRRGGKDLTVPLIF